MNLLIILGVVLVGLGTYLTILGSQKKSDNSERKILSEIEKTREKTESRIKEILDTSELSDKQQEEIEKVKNEFDDWASELKSSLEKKKIEIQKSELTVNENSIELNDKYRYLYTNYFNSISSIIDAINSKIDYNIQYDIPDLPQNVFNSEYKEYLATVFFNNNIQWNISFRPNEKTSMSPFPSIWLFIVKNDKDHSREELDIFSIRFEPEKNIYGLILVQNNYLNLKSFNFENLMVNYYPLDQVNDFSKTLIELQIITEY